MSRKTNSTSLKLGKTQVWTSSFQKYGNSFTTFFPNFQISYNLFLLISILTEKNHFSLNLIKCYIKFNKLVFIVYSHSEKKFNPYNAAILTKSFNKLNYNCAVQFYSKNFMFNSSLILAYFKKLVTLNWTPKKTLTTLTTLLIKNIGFKKKVYSRFGVQQLLLEGFKIRMTGRLENSKTSMAQAIEQTYGILPLVKLSNYVEYSNFFIFSKLGICNFQVWLFYKVTN